MARESSDREDLLREATALVERVELQVVGFDEPIVVGFRRDGAASFYFGSDVVYQFNADSELRRGFLDGQLYKANCGRLAALTPLRTETQTELRRHDLTEAETERFLMDTLSNLRQLSKSLLAGKFQIVGQVPAGDDVLARVRQWLAVLPEIIPIAGSPRV
jgi:hypothetical protein